MFRSCSYVLSLVVFVFSSSSSSIWFGLAEMYGLSYFLFFSSSTGGIRFVLAKLFHLLYYLYLPVVAVSYGSVLFRCFISCIICVFQ